MVGVIGVGASSGCGSSASFSISVFELVSLSVEAAVKLVVDVTENGLEEVAVVVNSSLLSGVSSFIILSCCLETCFFWVEKNKKLQNFNIWCAQTLIRISKTCLIS